MRDNSDENIAVNVMKYLFRFARCLTNSPQINQSLSFYIKQMLISIETVIFFNKTLKNTFKNCNVHIFNDFYD